MLNLTYFLHILDFYYLNFGHEKVVKTSLVKVNLPIMEQLQKQNLKKLLNKI
jgi:hypothetical protein